MLGIKRGVRNMNKGKRTTRAGGCSVDGCEGPIKSKSLCDKHYARMRRHGDVHVTLKSREHSDVCSVEGCNNPYKSAGYCEKHYVQFRRNGDFKPKPKKVCTVKGCQDLHVARGLCKNHYQAWHNQRKKDKERVDDIIEYITLLDKLDPEELQKFKNIQLLVQSAKMLADEVNLLTSENANLKAKLGYF